MVSLRHTSSTAISSPLPVISSSEDPLYDDTKTRLGAMKIGVARMSVVRHS